MAGRQNRYKPAEANGPTSWVDETASARDAFVKQGQFTIWSDYMLCLIAPAILVVIVFFIDVTGVHLAGDVHRFAAKVNTTYHRCIGRFRTVARIDNPFVWHVKSLPY